MSFSLLPDLFMQCGDAITYIATGEACALEGACYDDIRPGGTGYWFSWPTRLGLPLTALVYAHIALLLISVWLSTRALLSITHNTDWKPASKFLLAVPSLAIHLLFLWPTMFVSLADPPASLFMLIGIWLLLLSCNTDHPRCVLSLMAGALLVGLASWIRAFYFYPLIASIGIGFIAFLFGKNKKLSFFLIFFALAFPSLQIYNTYKSTGKMVYLHSKKSEFWNSQHLESSSIGYDTIFPYYGYYYQPKYCEVSQGLLDSIRDHNYPSLFCLLGNRLAFYLATYREATYIYPGTKNHLFIAAIEDIGDPTYWLAQNLDVQKNIAKDPFGDMTADKVTIKPALPEDEKNLYLSQWVALPSKTEYGFSVWLWSDNAGEMEIVFANHEKNLPLGRKTVSLTTTPQRFFVTGKTQEPGVYSVSIGNPPFTDNGASLSIPSPFYAWGAQLEEGSSMTEYAGIEELEPDKIRQWHPTLLAANLLAIVFALLFLIRTRHVFFTNPVYPVAVSIVVISFSQALLIIPEQRFMIACMIFIWLLAMAELVFSIKKFIRRE